MDSGEHWLILNIICFELLLSFLSVAMSVCLILCCHRIDSWTYQICISSKQFVKSQYFVTCKLSVSERFTVVCKFKEVYSKNRPRPASICWSHCIILWCVMRTWAGGFFYHPWSNCQVQYTIAKYDYKIELPNTIAQIQNPTTSAKRIMSTKLLITMHLEYGAMWKSFPKCYG